MLSSRSRRLVALLTGAALAAIIALPVAASRDFGTVYVDGAAYRTFGVPARVDPGTGTDPIVAFTNFEQGGVAQYAPGQGSHGGRWAVWMATWTDPSAAHLVTDFDDVIALEAAGALTLERVADADFRCPLLPDRGGGG
jgi:hypothetical protein